MAKRPASSHWRTFWRTFVLKRTRPTKHVLAGDRVALFPVSRSLIKNYAALLRPVFMPYMATPAREKRLFVSKWHLPVSVRRFS